MRTTILKHPVFVGIGFEALLVGTFILFPVGPCVSSTPGVVVLCLHYPGFLVSAFVFKVESDSQHLIVAPLVMAAIWISLPYGLRRLLRARDATPDGDEQ